MTEPLPSAIQMLNQRFLAEGCLPGDEAEEIWQSLSQHDTGSATSLKSALILSNRQLAFANLEIRGVIVDNMPYYAMVNKEADGIAKAGFATSFGVTQINYIRLILEHLAEGPCSRASLINLKHSLKDKDGLTTEQAVEILDKLAEEHWIWPKAEYRHKRTSMQTPVELAPRAYMELTYMLKEQFGMEAADMPQQIVF